MLRGELGGSLKGAEVPMRTRRGGSEIQDPDDEGDEGLEADFSVLTCWSACLVCR